MITRLSVLRRSSETEVIGTIGDDIIGHIGCETFDRQLFNSRL